MVRHTKAEQPMRRQERQALRRRATWNMQTREKEEKDWISQGTMIGIQTSGRRTNSQKALWIWEGGRHRLRDTKVINAAVQSEVLSVDCAPNEGGIIGISDMKSCRTILKMPNLSCFYDKAECCRTNQPSFGGHRQQVCPGFSGNKYRKLMKAWTSLFWTGFFNSPSIFGQAI